MDPLASRLVNPVTVITHFHNVFGYFMRNVLHYEHTVATYNVITDHKVIPAHNFN